MGRHSAPDDDAELAAEPEAQQIGWNGALALRAGRHASDDEPPPAAEDERETTVLPIFDVFSGSVEAPEEVRDEPLEPQPATPEPEQAEQRAPEAAPAQEQPKPAPARERATHADLRLLRENPALRARCAAGVIVPFVLYVITLVILGAMAQFLLWVWIPTVAAGVIVGTFLDVAHHRERKNG